VNAFVIKHSNPDSPGEVPRHADIVFRRPASYPFFKTLWQTIFTGIKACAGIGPAVQPQKDQSIFSKITTAASKIFKKKGKTPQ